MKFEPAELQELAKAVSEMMIRDLRPLLPKNGQVVDGLLTVEGLANYLEISETKIYKMIKEKRIPHERIDGCIRFDREEVKAHFKKGATQ